MAFNKLKRIRTEHGITQDRMAQTLGMKRQSYAHKENGIRPFKLKEVEAISNLLGLRVEDIFFDNKATQCSLKG